MLIVGAVLVLVIGGVLVAGFLNGARDVDAEGPAADISSDAGTGAADGDGSGTPGQSDLPRVGDCLSDEAPMGQLIGSAEMPEVISCDDPRAAFEVLHVREEPTGTRCIDVEGATDAMWFTEGPVEALCLMRADGDKARNINTIDVGECVAVEGQFMVRAECGSPGSYRVLALFDDPTPLPKSFDGPIPPCVDAGVPEATTAYQWGIPDEPGVMEARYQRGICLTEAG